jgi:hypothetical protein
VERIYIEQHTQYIVRDYDFSSAQTWARNRHMLRTEGVEWYKRMAEFGREGSKDRLSAGEGHAASSSRVSVESRVEAVRRAGKQRASSGGVVSRAGKQRGSSGESVSRVWKQRGSSLQHC